MHDYTLGRVLGEGASGEVRLATRAGRDYALKIVTLTRGHAVDMQPFLREVLLIRTACALVDTRRLICVEDDQVWFTPDRGYRPSGILVYTKAEATVEERVSTLSLDVRDEIIRQVGTTLQILHNAGLAHGDVAMRNIMLQEGTRPYLIDFGLACLRPTSRAATTAAALMPDLLSKYRRTTARIQREHEPSSQVWNWAERVGSTTAIDVTCRVSAIASEDRLPARFYSQYRTEFARAVANDTYMLAWTYLELLHGEMVFLRDGDDAYTLADAIRDASRSSSIRAMLTTTLGVSADVYKGRISDVIAATTSLDVENLINSTRARFTLD